jgi:hypothetical protein
MPPEEKQSSLLNLPVTLEDYVTLCRKRDFGAIDLVSKRLLALESKMVESEAASLILDKTLRLILSTISSSQNAHALITDSFVQASVRLHGKAIFLGFISECTKYFEGAIVPIGQEGILVVYLPIPPNPLKVMCSPDLKGERVISIAAGFGEIWIDEVNHRKIITEF